MRISPRVLTSAAAIALTCAATAAAYFYRSRSAEVNEVMVFCKLQFNAYGCFDQLMSYIEAAKKSVSICMPGIQNVAIHGRLVRMMRERGIKVRIIVDQSSYDPTDFLLKELIELGAEVKPYSNPQHQLQLKFCLVDDKVLLTGTLNWGNDRSSDHWNYVYITSKSQLVHPVKERFNFMWNYKKQPHLGQENLTIDNNETDHNESDIDRESHTEDHESYTADHESHTEDQSHTEDHGSHTEDHEGHIDGNESHTEDHESQQRHTDCVGGMNVSQIINLVTDFSESPNDSQTFRQTVSTPELYII